MRHSKLKNSPSCITEYSFVFMSYEIISCDISEFIEFCTYLFRYMVLLK